MHQGDAVSSDHLFESGPGGVKQAGFCIGAVELPVTIPDQMSEDFGVRFSGETVIAFFDQLLFQSVVIFDDSVVHERDFARGVKVRVRVFIVDLAVRGPARVADAVGT